MGILHEIDESCKYIKSVKVKHISRTRWNNSHKNRKNNSYLDDFSFKSFIEEISLKSFMFK